MIHDTWQLTQGHASGITIAEARQEARQGERRFGKAGKTALAAVGVELDLAQGGKEERG